MRSAQHARKLLPDKKNRERACEEEYYDWFWSMIFCSLCRPQSKMSIAADVDGRMLSTIPSRAARSPFRAARSPRRGP